MPPVPVHIDAPITPQKPEASNSEASATQQEQPPAYPAARPGAPAVPAPTGSPYTPNPYQPQPTRTTDVASNNGPPPPQPGAVPIGLSQKQNPNHTPTTALPPPPKAGEVAKLREQLPFQPAAPPAITTMPAQMAFSPPDQNSAPTHTTTTTTDPLTRASGSGPTTLNFGAVFPIAGGIAPPSHPPGYQQNTMAQEMSPAARRSLDAQEGYNSGSVFGGGSGSTGVLGGGNGAGGGAGGVWDTVKGYASSLQQGAIEAEKRVWERINQK